MVSEDTANSSSGRANALRSVRNELISILIRIPQLHVQVGFGIPQSLRQVRGIFQVLIQQSCVLLSQSILPHTLVLLPKHLLLLLLTLRGLVVILFMHLLRGLVDQCPSSLLSLILIEVG